MGQTYHTDRQVSEQRTTQKCAADGGGCKGLSLYLYRKQGTESLSGPSLEKRHRKPI
ncbi:hypothetical protein HMPREF9371_1560 [Neisseria shayeganii 871]|uniref:Uncharacterized protein n=1 Tax=Neisseria shayeganii 871 TaxID=1032488 RepID=G4CIX1_9NEIS|nr:hypothetical protein HMPREF9371_1560 [Neisseria shayeganii 871]